LTACAAAAAVPLVSRNDTLSVIPATLEETELSVRLAGAVSAAVVKLGRHVKKVRRVLSQLCLLDGAVYVEHATLPTQRVMPLALVDAGEAPYFSMALVCPLARDPIG
jgi:precorrin-2/cobalt-factor-2 C20-methyltransferase